MKKCSKCKEVKVFSQFYRMRNSKDGYQGRCKDCALVDRKEKRRILMEDPKWVEQERERQREKQRRLWTPKRSKEYRNRYPEMIKARRIAQKIKIKKGFSRHHWSYREEHHSDIIPLKKKQHYKLHTLIKYEPLLYFFRRIDTGELLDTKDKHMEFIKQIIKHEN